MRRSSDPCASSLANSSGALSCQSAHLHAASSKRSSNFPPRGCVDTRVLQACHRLQVAVRSCLEHCSCCFPSENLNAEERLELERLRSDASIVILPADKGGKWTIMPRPKYLAETERQLSDTTQYRETSENLDGVMGRRLTSNLKQLQATGFIKRKELLALLPPPDARPRRFYLRPKIHKEVWPDPEMLPGRPIVSDVGSVSRPCASLVEHFLAPIAQAAPSYLRDSHHLLPLLLDVNLCDDSLFFTMDVASLYNNIPVEGGLQAVSDAFLEHKDTRRPDLSILSILRLLSLSLALSLSLSPSLSIYKYLFWQRGPTAFQEKSITTLSHFSISHKEIS